MKHSPSPRPSPQGEGESLSALENAPWLVTFPSAAIGGSHLQQSNAHRDHEPKAPASRTHSKRFASLRSVETARQRLECVELAPALWVRFMGGGTGCTDIELGIVQLDHGGGKLRQERNVYSPRPSRTLKPRRGEMFSEHCAPTELKRVWRPKTINIAALRACLCPATIANSMAVVAGEGER